MAWLGLLLGFGALSGLSLEVGRFERQAAAEVASKLQGDQKRVSIRAELGLPPFEIHRASITASDFTTPGLPLFTEPQRSRRGKIHTLDLKLQNFELRGLKVESLEATIPHCRFDWDLAVQKRQFRLSQSGVGTGRVRIREADLAAWILRKFHEVKTVSVKVMQDIVWVEGSGEFLIAKTNFAVIAKLEAEDGVRIRLTQAKIYLDWQRADALTAQVLLDALNPVVDLRADLGLYDAVSIEGFRLRDGVLEAWGKTKIPDLPAPSSGSAPPFRSTPPGRG
ncbi:MAG TPA: LmeA family phospholipid-binding protein [Fimbriimonadaceae bacterium]|nr:LmeA family phospholipid-binding protein [Fimbriimonadaceae bacterium]HRJ32740.1 LmeA family phospholipid-binding protein [Fimbriimonadaceae bacterium]